LIKGAQGGFHGEIQEAGPVSEPDEIEMKEYKFTEYFENEVLRKRPYIKKEWCIRIIENPLRSEPQEHNRYRFWGIVDELNSKVLRVVTLSDRLTIHNAFLDRGYKP